MIRRIVNVVLLLLAISGAVVTYGMKHKAELAAERVEKLQADIAKEKDALTLLRAEWSVLTQPGRLEEVTTTYKEHFQLEPFSPQQVARIEDIPLRPQPDAKRTVHVSDADPLAALMTGAVR